MGAIPKMCRSAKKKVVTAALCGDGGLLPPEYLTHQLACTAIATPKLCLRPSTDKHTTCWRRVGLRGEQRSETGLSVFRLNSMKENISIANKSEVSVQIRPDKLTTYLSTCFMCCLWQTMDSTSWLEPWLFSRVTAHWSELKVL